MANENAKQPLRQVQICPTHLLKNAPTYATYRSFSVISRCANRFHFEAEQGRD